ncbi:M15 family metallopeptidase [Virgibacillus alimentarius]|uniref:M15 family metallopeptidase n=1 Tax=Virgibacillus alimentarius TaxID=698769 RepID=UPI00049313EB|nr:M15 family metallopeptidase [Virgibacillus alimentarius]
MKHLKKDFVAWVIVVLFVMMVFTIYHQMNQNRYEYIENKDDDSYEQLHPIVSEKMEELLDKAAKQNIHVVITETVRTMEKQEELYAQGRSSEGNIITYAQAGESYHNYGLAIDFAIENSQGDVIWDTSYDGNNNGKSDWLEVADIAKELGFEWGGDWPNFKDFPHLQMSFGLSIEELKKGKRPLK